MAAVLFLARNLYTVRAEWVGFTHEFCDSPAQVQIVFLNACNWSKWNLQHVCNSSESFVLKDMFLHLIHMFICFAYLWMSWAVSLNRGYNTFEAGKPLKNLFFFHYLFSKRISAFKKVSAAFSPSLKHSFMQTFCFLTLPFPRWTKITTGRTHACT